jgi:biopolymer transport protein TolQ
MSLFLFLPAAADTYKVDVFKVLVEASGMVQAVLLILIFMSLACWFIIGTKWFYFDRAWKGNRSFLRVFFDVRDLDRIFELSTSFTHSPVARVFREAYKEMGRLKATEEKNDFAMDNIERTLRRARQEETERSERMVPFLGTTGATAPFIGLFGTVWGIVEAFDRIPKVQGGVILDKVAGPMAHALVATAVGLLAAIPAVMAYNWFVRKVRAVNSQIDGFNAEFLNIVRRHFFH